jgi:hypothetical protein
VCGVSFELVAELGQVDAQVAGLLALRRTPDVVQELVAADELAVVAGEQFEDASLSGGEPDLLPAPTHHLVGEVNREIAGLKRSLRLATGGDGGGGAPDGCA